MKIFVFLFLVTICQADMYERDQEAFTFLSNLNTKKIVQTVENEVSKLMHKQLSPNEAEWVRDLASDFADSLREELEKAVFMVTQSGDLNRQFTSRMLEHLRRAADSIASGLDMTQDMLDKFIEDLMKDITHLEDTGLLDIDLDSIFQGVAARALTFLEEKTRKRRDLSDIFDTSNDTLAQIIGRMRGRFQDLHNFFDTHLKVSHDKVQPHIENVKILARTFITNIKSAQENVLQHAVEFFTPFALRMGETYMSLLSTAQSRLRKLAETPIPAIYK